MKVFNKIFILVYLGFFSAISFANEPIMLNKPCMIKSRIGDLYIDLKGYNLNADLKSNLTLYEKDNGLDKGLQGVDRVFVIKKDKAHAGTFQISSLIAPHSGISLVGNNLKIKKPEQFNFYDAGDGYLLIEIAGTGQLLTATNDKTITLGKKTGRSNQQWKLDYILPGMIAPPNNKMKFSIHPALNPGLSIDVPGSAPNQRNGESLKIWTNQDQPDRYFTVYQAEKNSYYYKIYPLHTGLAFDLSKDSTKNKAKKELSNAVDLVKGKKTTSSNLTRLKLKKKNSSNSQLFKFVHTGEPSTYYIINKGSGKYLTINTNNQAEKGLDIFEYKFLNGNANQKWILKELPRWAEPPANQKFYIKTAYADKYFDLPGDGHKTNTEGLKFMLWNLNAGGSDKVVKLLPSGENIWRNIQVQNGGKFITVPGNLKDNGTPLILQNKTGGNDQKFAIYPTSKSTFLLRSRNWKTVDIPNAKFNNGTKITIYDNNLSKAQQFQLIYADGPRIGEVFQFNQ